MGKGNQSKAISYPLLRQCSPETVIVFMIPRKDDGSGGDDDDDDPDQVTMTIYIASSESDQAVYINIGERRANIVVSVDGQLLCLFVVVVVVPSPVLLRDASVVQREIPVQLIPPGCPFARGLGGTITEWAPRPPSPSGPTL